MGDNKFFSEINKNFGFGCMRLPMIENEIDFEQVNKMVDTFLENDFNYFDTAHGYLDGKSEIALRECLVKRHPRESFILTNKLSTTFFKSEEEIMPLFEEQLKACGVEYFDFYLMHSQNASSYEKYQKCNAYEVGAKLKEMGKIKHLGLSFHDKADVLDRILTDHPEVEVVQIQFNYVDYEDEAVQSRKVYEVCEKHGKPVIVMEPVKGGSLVNLPEEAQKVFDEVNNGLSYASYAVRFAASFSNMMMVLSGMSTIEQMQDNIGYMKDFKPLNDEELKAVEKVRHIFESIQLIKCTGCHYCVLDNKCPKNIRIPEVFASYNKKKIFNDWNVDFYYNHVLTRDSGKASDCLKCGMCEKICPQHLSIRSILQDVSKEFEK